ncbi:hypothetical protein QN277_026045 [Acacia crassicarpa]|uniref:SWIM-type domain-containing protein n=1 Tax=Acacia crassicarpa TaxID=499986 RepID=A0AAE1J736_9FABA|nr:hypothetical protein QN277_026045 [Acacia crassicarpa]
MNDVNKETDRVDQVCYDNISGKGKEIVHDEEGHCSEDSFNRSGDEDSDDGTYVGLSSSSDTEESVFDDFEGREVNVDPLSDNEEDWLGRGSDDEPMQEPNVLQETQAAATRPHFFVCMTFEDKEEVKRAIDKYAVTRGVSLKVVRSDKRTYQVVCEEGCPFSLYLSTYGLSIGWQVKSLVYDHKCACVYKNQRASTMWLAQHFRQRVQEAPNFKSKDMKNEVQRELKVCASLHKCKRAKKMIMEAMEGSFMDEFSKIEAYCNELKLSNPGSDVHVEVSEEALEQGRRVFKRMYLCFNAAKVGWRQGCRPLIGVDETFLKGKARGIMLTAMGIDGNDSVYPLALALVEKENAHHWAWFLQWLRHSLDLGNGETVTLISDMQKGLANAVGDVLPEAEHRFCARHIYANWSKKWRGNELKKKFFTCAWSSYPQEFKDNLSALGSLKKEAAEDVVSYNVNAWVRAYFTPRCKSWMVDNNISESFNASIDECRFLPVIRMIDGIRLKMMAKWAESEANVSGWHTEFSPKCMDLFECNKFLSVDCKVHFNGDEGYEVVEGQDRHLVYLSTGMCTCRAWDLTGIPCQHAICAMYHAKVDPKSRISQYYHKETYLATYRTKLLLVRGKNFWDTENFLPMLPPPLANLLGRPPKKRRRTDEATRRRKISKVGPHASGPSGSAPPNNIEQIVVERLTRRGKSHKCTHCNQPGHNKATCKEPSIGNDHHNTRTGRKQSSHQPRAPQQEQQAPDPLHSQPSQQPPDPTQAT